VTDSRASLRARRDAAAAHFAIAMFIGFASAAVFSEIPDGGWAEYARMAAVATFLMSFLYSLVAWLRAASAHWQLRQTRNQP
jgi:hypothetical protein